MAYQPYYPGYPPYYGQPVPDQLAQLRQNQFQQQPVQPIQQQMQGQSPQIAPVNPMGQTNSNGMIWVSGRQEADGYLIAPNSAVALWDANNPVVYLRKADSTGKPSTVVYDLVERTDNPVQQQATPQLDLSGYVTWDKLDEYLSDRLKRPSKAAQKKEDE